MSGIPRKFIRSGLLVDYYDKFIPGKEADNLVEVLERDVEYLTGNLAQVKVRGIWHEMKRSHAAYGDEGVDYRFSGITIPAKPWLPCLLEIRDRLLEVTGERFNFVLVNRYADGNQTIGYHSDNERDLDHLAPIASVSLGAARNFLLKPKMGKPNTVRINLGHGSLLMMIPPTNTRWLHSLPPTKKQVAFRINLTFRRIRSEKRLV